MLRDIVKDAVATQPDMEVVAEIPDCTTLAVVAERTHTDVAVVGRDFSASSEEDGELLCRCSGVPLLALTNDGRNAFSLRLRPELVALGAEAGDVSTQLLVDAIRGVMQRRAP